MEYSNEYVYGVGTELPPIDITKRMDILERQLMECMVIKPSTDKIHAIKAEMRKLEGLNK